VLEKIPSIRSARPGDSRLQIENQPDGSVPVCGPAWIEQTLAVLKSNPAWAPFVYGGPSSPRSQIRVDAPAEISPAPSDIPDAVYSIEIRTDLAVVTCTSRLGLVTALRTMSALMLSGDTGRGTSIPTGTFDDSPAFRWRGMHLDVGRHMFSVDFIKRLLELMASLGFNVFHWHLTEDQGWRIQIDSYPKLTEVGAWRTGPDGVVYGGYYTRDQVRDVVAYAGALGIMVLPEIELPGHATAAIAAYPELSCRGEPIQVQTRWGVCDDVFCPGAETLFDFVEAVFAEVAELFPSRFVHLGGDECPRTRWAECPKCRARMEAEGLSDLDQLQSYTVTRAAGILGNLGRKAVGWDEILEGGLPPQTLVMSWRGTQGGVAAAHAGHEVIMTPTSHCYFDYRQHRDPDAFGFSYRDENGNIPVTTIETVYEFDPLCGLSEGARANVLGGQANLWSELLTTDELAEMMIAPRILAMAEVLWAYPAERNFSSFRPRLQAALRVLRSMGWHPADVPELA